MMNDNMTTNSQAERGSILMAAMMVILIAGFSVGALALYASQVHPDLARLTRERGEIGGAF